jgi:UDP-glucose 4-epimerase
MIDMGEILVTGGAGYVGTHVLCVLAAAGRRCVSIDNHSNSSPQSIERVREIAPGSIEAFEVDVRDKRGLRGILRGREIDSVIHLAGLKAVAESIRFPDKYHDNNVRGTASLLEALVDTPARKFVFSSSATVYGAIDAMPMTESSPTAPGSPYGENKLAIENMLVNLVREDPEWRIASLRYFNPVGAHESGLIGEDPAGIPNNLMPCICQVAAGRREKLEIFGNDYPTPDGTGVRDYIHVLDLAQGHVAAIDALDRAPGGTAMTLNLGTGRGHSVLEVVEAFERANDVKVPREFVERRPGDIAACYADATLAKAVLAWEATRGMEAMCRDAWRWQRMNPNGYEG